MDKEKIVITANSTSEDIKEAIEFINFYIKKRTPEVMINGVNLEVTSVDYTMEDCETVINMSLYTNVDDKKVDIGNIFIDLDIQDFVIDYEDIDATMPDKSEQGFYFLYLDAEYIADKKSREIVEETNKILKNVNTNLKNAIKETEEYLQ